MNVHQSKLNSLKRKVDATLASFRKTITDLEAANAEYAKLSKDISKQMDTLASANTEITNRSLQNTKVISKFKPISSKTVLATPPAEDGRHAQT